MKQYRITTENLLQDDLNDAYLSPDDPIHELKIASSLGGLGSEEKLAQYRQKTILKNKEINKANINGLSPAEKRQLEREHNIKPGTPEWFQLHFSKTTITGELPIRKVNES